jgi:hypothetical protein
VVDGILTTGEGLGATLLAGDEEDGGAIGGAAAIGEGAALGSFTGVGVKRGCAGGVTIGAETAGGEIEGAGGPTSPDFGRVTAF